MNTTNETTADVKAAKYDQALLVAELSRLSAQASAELGTPTIIYATSVPGGHFSVHAFDKCALGGTVDIAVKQIAQKIGTPEQRAAEKRMEAHRLIIEAQAISPEAAA